MPPPDVETFSFQATFPVVKTTIVVLVLVVAAACAGGYFLFRNPRSGAGPKYETAPAERGRIVARVTASGTL